MGASFSFDKIPSMAGKVVIVTGANTGIGEVTTREIARRGGHVVMACRSLQRGEECAARIRAAVGGGEVDVMELDLASIASVNAFADAFLARALPLHVLVNNAGIMMCPFRVTVDGVESQWGTNHLGHFQLVRRLLGVLEQSAPSRVVVLSSLAHSMTYPEGIRFDKISSEEGYGPVYAYGQSKLSNLLFAVELAKRVEGKRIYVNAVHPGYVRTELTRNIGDAYGSWTRPVSWVTDHLFAKSPDNGALTSLYVATSPEIEEKDYRGRYFEPTAVLGEPSKFGKDAAMAKRLWDFSEESLDRILSSLSPVSE